MLRRKGISLLSVKGRATPSIDEQEASRIAEERFLQMGFPRWIGPVHLPLARVRKRSTSAQSPSWERVCWIARTRTFDVRGPHHRVVMPTYQQAGIVIVAAETGEVHLSHKYLRSWS